MIRPKQFLIDECDSDVIDYIEYLEGVEEHYDKIMDVLEDMPVDINEIIGEN